jgi:hypothetical protein
MFRGYPQYTVSAKQGNIGVGIVTRLVEGFGWLFKRNPQEFDFGIDGQIEVVSESGAVTGQILACQIKCGKSYFAESNSRGLIYRGETKHFNYLANYPVPVIVIICDPESGDGLWVDFQPKDAQMIESGWKITVPFANKLSSSKPKLEALLSPLTDYLGELQEYWRANNLLLNSQTILFAIDRAEVESADVSRVSEFRERLTSSRELALHCQGKIELSFNGYDKDPRELFEIEIARRYLALLDEVLFELFFFVRTDPPANTLKLFLFCLFGAGWESERPKSGKPGKYMVDFSAMGPFLNRHFTGLNYICEWLGLPEEEIKRISLGVMTPLGYEPSSADQE